MYIHAYMYAHVKTPCHIALVTRMRAQVLAMRRAGSEAPEWEPAAAVLWELSSGQVCLLFWFNERDLEQQ